MDRVLLDGDTCYRALLARDARFDGVFFVGVRTTGIYCRPVCRAKTPGRDRCMFYRTAAEAERASFRACFRCRPELSPGLGPVDAVSRLSRSAAQRIEAGYLNEASVDDLAAELGVTARHLRRAMLAELGVSPVDLAQARRLSLAKQLLCDTKLPLAEVAFASGFASVRRFNAVFHDRFKRPPSAFRRGVRERAGASDHVLPLRLDHRPPLDWETMLEFLAPRAIPGVEVVEGGAYARSVRIGGSEGWVVVRRDRGRDAVRAEVSLSLASALMPLAAKLRALFDLDAHPRAVAAHLGRDPDLAARVKQRPGLRVPGAFDAFETAARAVLGQQVSVRAATTLSGRIVETFGDRIATPLAGIERHFPTATQIAEGGEDAVAAVGMPRPRARALVALARAFAAGSLPLAHASDPEAATASLLDLPGIGAWTAEYLAMRALGWPDAFPASDLALRKALGGVTPREAAARAEPWRPFRSYAAMHLWTGAVARRA
jgi:AraC family transcriptional regulator of adaptative response / DNA-3-methyladenine glycosylase II